MEAILLILVLVIFSKYIIRFTLSLLKKLFYIWVFFYMSSKLNIPHSISIISIFIFSKMAKDLKRGSRRISKYAHTPFESFQYQELGKFVRILFEMNYVMFLLNTYLLLLKKLIYTHNFFYALELVLFIYILIYSIKIIKYAIEGIVRVINRKNRGLFA